MTKDEAQTQLDTWIAADASVSQGQSYSVDGLSLSRADVELITNKINFWQKQVNAYEAVEAGLQQGVKSPRFN